MAVPEGAVFGKGLFENDRGNTECVEFVRKVTGAPFTPAWRSGKRILGASPGEIPRGTAIATFDEWGSYPTDHKGKHAAIYLWHDARCITVLHQWNSVGKVVQREIRFHNPGTPAGRSNDGDTFYVVEVMFAFTTQYFTMKSTRPCSLILVLLCIARPASATPASCPAFITVTETAADAPVGWNVLQHSVAKRRLLRVGIHGRAALEAEFVPDDESTDERDVWTLTPHPADAGDGPYWVFCYYEHTDVVLARPLPPETGECIVTYEPRAKDRSHGTVKGFDCHASRRPPPPARSHDDHSPR